MIFIAPSSEYRLPAAGDTSDEISDATAGFTKGGRANISQQKSFDVVLGSEAAKQFIPKGEASVS